MVVTYRQRRFARSLGQAKRRYIYDRIHREIEAHCVSEHDRRVFLRTVWTDLMNTRPFNRLNIDRTISFAVGYLEVSKALRAA